MRWNLARSSLIFPLLLLAGCGSRVFQEPEVTLQSVHLAGLGLRGGTLMVNVEITNPNRFALSANEVRYQLAIADTESLRDTAWIDLASGRYAEPISIASGRTESVQVPVEFSYAGLGGAGASLLRAGTFNYRASGVVDVRTPVGSYAIPFRRGGMVTLMGAR